MSTPLDDFRCASCQHRAKSHVAFFGPCSACWRRGIKICHRFRLQEKDRAAVEAIKI